MTDVAVPTSQANDPNNRDPNRTPMQWTGAARAGFTTGEPWLPTPAQPMVNVAYQRGDRASLLRLYQRLLELRSGRISLTDGSHHTYDLGDDRLFVFERRLGAERTLVALNFSSEPVTAAIPAGQGEASCLLSTGPGRPAGPIDLAPLQLSSHEGVICDLGRQA
jgi:alpha-glucosidase